MCSINELGLARIDLSSLFIFRWLGERHFTIADVVRVLASAIPEWELVHASLVEVRSSLREECSLNSQISSLGCLWHNLLRSLPRTMLLEGIKSRYVRVRLVVALTVVCVLVVSSCFLFQLQFRAFIVLLT